MQRLELKGKQGFNGEAAPADILDVHRLEHHHVAPKLADDEHPFSVALVLILHGAPYSTDETRCIVHYS